MSIQKKIEVFGDSLLKGVQMRIEIFGDSILKGVQLDTSKMRYHVDNNIDLQLIGSKHSLDITNHSRFGCTVTKGYDLIKKWLHGNTTPCNAMIMDFGGNDCDYIWKDISERPYDEHLPNTPIDIFVETYHKIIDLLKKHSVPVILTTLPPLEPQRFFDWFCKGLNKENVMKWLGTVNAIYRAQESYSRAIENIASETNTMLVDLRGAFLKHRYIEDYLCEDGTHPNTKGQKIITDALMEFADMVALRSDMGFDY